MGIPMWKIRGSRDRLYFDMGIPIMVRRHLYTETVSKKHRLVVPLTSSKTPSRVSYGIFVRIVSWRWRHNNLRWRLKSPASWLFAQPLVETQIKAPRHWPLWGETTGDLWNSNTENVDVIMWRIITRHNSLKVMGINKQKLKLGHQ